MRNPNGFGNVSKLSGNRRKPWRVRKTDGWEIVNGTVKQKFINIGCYETQAEALLALAKYNESPYNMEKSKITLQ
jgi:hypothetical protein